MDNAQDAWTEWDQFAQDALKFIHHQDLDANNAQQDKLLPRTISSAHHWPVLLAPEWTW